MGRFFRFFGREREEGFKEWVLKEERFWWWEEEGLVGFFFWARRWVWFFFFFLREGGEGEFFFWEGRERWGSGGEGGEEGGEEVRWGEVGRVCVWGGGRGGGWGGGLGGVLCFFFWEGEEGSGGWRVGRRE